MTDILKNYQDLLDNECLPIQQQETNEIDHILRETGFCILAGYHGSGKSSLARRYSHYKQHLKRIYCKNIIPKDVLSELEKDTQPLFLDSVTDLLYDESTFQTVKDRAKKSPVVLGVHIEPQNRDQLFSQYQKNLMVIGSLDYDDAKLLASCPLDEDIPYLNQLLEYSGMRRRDLINLCIEAYSIQRDFSSKSIEEGTINLADKSQRVYKHIFEEHFTEQQREIIRAVLAGNSEIRDNVDTGVLVRTGIIKEKFTLNGKLLELIFKKVLS